MYHAPLGRFSNRDPIRYAASSNLLAYAYARPTYVVDPNGLIPPDMPPWGAGGPFEAGPIPVPPFANDLGGFKDYLGRSVRSISTIAKKEMT